MFPRAQGVLTAVIQSHENMCYSGKKGFKGGLGGVISRACSSAQRLLAELLNAHPQQNSALSEEKSSKASQGQILSGSLF